MKTKLRVLILIILGLLVSGIQMNSYATDKGHAADSAKTSTDHEALAKFYDESAKEMQSKLQEHENMLKKYQAESQHYGRQGLNMESMCRALIRTHEQAVKENLDMAAAHRKMIEESK